MCIICVTGEVIGVSTMKAIGVTGIAFAVQIDEVINKFFFFFYKSALRTHSA